MALNCKQGDLALIISGGAAGMMVTCLELLPAGFYRDDLPPGVEQQFHPDVGPLWRVDRLIQWGAPKENQRHGISTVMRVIPDWALMPIRPDTDRSDDVAVEEKPASFTAQRLV